MLDSNLTYCGDIIELIRDIPDDTIDCVISDPPFNQNKNYDGHDDNMNDSEYFEWCDIWLKEYFRVLKNTGSIYVQINSKKVISMGMLMNKYGYFQNQCIWIKHTNPTPQTKRYAKNYQPWLFYTKSEKDYKFFPKSEYVMHRYEPYKQIGNRNVNGRMVDDIWEDIPDLVSGFLSQSEVIKDDNGKKIHNQQMPIALAKRMILHSTGEGDTVLDGFMGTGTVCAAAKQLNRKYIGFDSNKYNCEVTDTRLQSISTLDKWFK